MKKKLVNVLIICMFIGMVGCGTDNAGYSEYFCEQSNMLDKDEIFDNFLTAVGCGTENSFRRYYYDQLNLLVEKEIYNNLSVAKEQFINNEEVLLIRIDSEEEYQYFFEEYEDHEVGCIVRSIEAFRRDNPLSFMWLEYSCIDISYKIEEEFVDDIFVTSWYLMPKDGGNYYHFENPEELREALGGVETIAQDFVATLEGRDEEKLKAIHDFIIEGAEYEETINSRNPYGPLVERKAVCAGYATAFKYLSDMAGLNVVYITGLSQNELHAWNYVKTDEWTLVDVTWDLGGYNDFLFIDIEDEILFEQHVPDDGGCGFSYTEFIE